MFKQCGKCRYIGLWFRFYRGYTWDCWGRHLMCKKCANDIGQTAIHDEIKRRGL